MARRESRFRVGTACAVQDRMDNAVTKNFENQIVLVTGGANGIGRATALAFAREGAEVIISDVADRAGEEVVALIHSQGGRADYVHADMAQPAEIARLIDGVVQLHGRLDIAFNNAGIEGTAGLVADLSLEAWDRVLRINLTGVFVCMKHEILHMEKIGHGAIVNNASILGQVGFATASAYVSAKHGVLGLTRTAALEYASKGIRVNAVCPGFIETPMLERAGILGDEVTRKSIESMHALNRLGTAEEVAAAVLFLASRNASFITGHPLLVDGGYVAR